MEDDRKADQGPQARKQCADHPNCVYRIELLERARDEIKRKLDGFKAEIDEKINSFQKLLIANLAGICTLLLVALIGTIVYIAKVI